MYDKWILVLPCLNRQALSLYCGMFTGLGVGHSSESVIHQPCQKYDCGGLQGRITGECMLTKHPIYYMAVAANMLLPALTFSPYSATLLDKVEDRCVGSGPGGKIRGVDVTLSDRPPHRGSTHDVRMASGKWRAAAIRPMPLTASFKEGYIEVLAASFKSPQLRGASLFY